MRLRSPMVVAVELLVIVLPAACVRRALSRDDAGGTGQVDIDGGGDASAGDVVSDAGGVDVAADGGAGDGGPITCGAVTCTGTELCVITAGCGGPLNCTDKPDGGPCPAGSTDSPVCLSALGRPGCLPDCPPSTYGCAPRPAACSDFVSCSCVDRSVCAVGVCVGIQGDRTVECGFE